MYIYVHIREQDRRMGQADGKCKCAKTFTVLKFFFKTGKISNSKPAKSEGVGKRKMKNFSLCVPIPVVVSNGVEVAHSNWDGVTKNRQKRHPMNGFQDLWTSFSALAVQDCTSVICFHILETLPWFGHRVDSLEVLLTYQIICYRIGRVWGVEALHYRNQAPFFFNFSTLISNFIKS